jgi:transcriptional regulator with XRE-family HTH domain
MSRQAKKIDGKKLQAYRKKAGLTQVELASKMDRSREWVSAIENNAAPSIYNIDNDTIEKWMSLCHRRISALGYISEANKLWDEVVGSVINIFTK